MRIGGMTLFLLIVCLNCYVAADLTLMSDDVPLPIVSCSDINMLWTRCRADPFCQPTCENPYQQPCTRKCFSGCVCMKNYLRSVTDGDICMHRQDC